MATDAPPLPPLPAGISAGEAAIFRGLDPVMQWLGAEHDRRMRAQHSARLVWRNGRRSAAQQQSIWDRTQSMTAAELQAAGLTGFAARPGTSRHELGLAYDVNPLPDSAANRQAMGVLGEALGLRWGGRWRKRIGNRTVTDDPHFELGSGAEPAAYIAAASVITALLAMGALLLRRQP